MAISCEPGQIRKKAAAAADSGAKVRLSGSATLMVLALILFGSSYREKGLSGTRRYRPVLHLYSGVAKTLQQVTQSSYEQLMSYQALARKWRPKIFDEVIGQEHVVSALTNALDNQRVHHAFLFTGTRGVGKTTLARIFAKALNCEQGISSTPCGKCVQCRGVDQGNFIDLIEVDAASRTKVDDTRELLDNVQYTPTQGRFKIYLIDEVHMLSTHSFNALLKTLEEPPDHVKFLLATTDPQKLPTTILSRCIQFNLKAMDTGRLTAQLEKILEAETVAHDQPALLVLARSANGSVRDALSLLDQAIAFGNGEVRTEQVRSMLGMIDDQFTRQLLGQVSAGEAAEVLQTVAAMSLRSVDFSNALDEILTMLHNISLYQVSPQAVEWKGIDSSSVSALAEQNDAEILQLFYQIALIGKRDLPLAPDSRSGFEMVLLRMISFRPDAAARPEVRKSADRTNSERPGPAGDTREGVERKVSRINPKSRSVNPVPTIPNPAVDGAGIKNKAGKSPARVAEGEGASTDSEENITDSRSIGETSIDTNTNADFGPAGLNISLDQLVKSDAWAAYVEQSGLSGMPRQMVMNMVPESVQGTTLNLTLNSEYSHLLIQGRINKIEKHLASQLSLPVKLAVKVGRVKGETGETPCQQQDRVRQEKQQAAQQAFSHDPNVQELVDLFDAEVVKDSIRPSSGLE